MRQLIFFLILFSNFVFSQQNRKELSQSNIFINADYINEINVNKSILYREFVKDTLINNIINKKYRINKFQDYYSKHDVDYYYESFDHNFYRKYDKNINLIHEINLNSEIQSAIFFGKREDIKRKFIDTGNSFPKDELKPTTRTPRKFINAKNNKDYLIFSLDLNWLIVEMKNNNYTKQLYADNILSISNFHNKKIEIFNKIDLNINDEIQIFYKRKYYDDESGKAEYEDKQLINFKYKGDTIINGKKHLLISHYSYNFLSRNEDLEKDYFYEINDNHYKIENFETPIKNYKTEMKILDDNQIFLQAITYKKIDNTDFPIITQSYSDSYYRLYIIPFFPTTIIEFGNLEGNITYLKIKGKEYGKKIIPNKKVAN